MVFDYFVSILPKLKRTEQKAQQACSLQKENEGRHVSHKLHTINPIFNVHSKRNTEQSN